jgi:hypothetical protein
LLNKATLNHNSANNISNIQVIFLDTAFTGITATAVTGFSVNNIAVTYNALQISYSSSTFTESFNNDGTISNTITMDISGDTFTGVDGDNFITGTKVSVSGVPTGLTAQVIRQNSTRLNFVLVGNATNHLDVNDINNLGIVFNDSAISGAPANSFNGYQNTSMVVDFLNPQAIAYSTTTFTESSNNDGSIAASITLTLTNDIFTGANGSDYIGDTKVSVSGVPAGLTATVTKNSGTTLTLALTGNATLHSAANNISNLTVIFANSAFTLAPNAALIGNYSRSDLNVNYYNQVALAYNVAAVNENTANVGGVSDTIIVTLSNDTFSGTNGDNFIASGKLVVSNLPAGLSAIANRDSATQLTISFTGTATLHSNASDIANLTFTLNTTALNFSTLATTIGNYNKNDLIVNFADPYTLSYSINSWFNASWGYRLKVTIPSSIITANMSNFPVYVNLANLPAAFWTHVKANGGDIVVTSADGYSQAPVQLANFNSGGSTGDLYFRAASLGTTGNNEFYVYYGNAGASQPAANSTYGSQNVWSANYKSVLHLDEASTGVAGEILDSTNSANNMQAPGAGNAPTQVTGASAKIGKALTFDGSDDYLNSTATASVLGINGALPKTISTWVKTSTFTGGNRGVWYLGQTGTNGLDYSFRIDGGTTDRWRSQYWGSDQDVSTLATPALNNWIHVTLVYDGTSSIAYINGEIANPWSGYANPYGVSLNTSDAVALQLGNWSGSYFQGVIDEFTVSSIARSSAWIAATYLNQNSPTSFYAVGNEQNYATSSTATMNEGSANDGSISTTATLTVVGTTFNGVFLQDFVAAGKASVANLPAGLTARLRYQTANTLTLDFTGNAASHVNANDISNFTVTLLDGAYTSAESDGVTGSVKNDLAINFDDNATLTYSATSFNETINNTGATPGSISISLSNLEFNGTIGDNFASQGKVIVSNVPAGLTASLTYVSATALSLSLSGSATAHANTNDITNLTVTFKPIAFTNGVATNVLNYIKDDLVVNFDDPALLSYSATQFNEAVANNGSIVTTSTISITNDTFAGIVNDDFIALSRASITNLPGGLAATLVKTSNTQLLLTLVGTAGSHINSDDISNLTLTFAASSFTNNTVASNVTNYNKNNLVVNFDDAPSLSYSALGTFSEAEINNGSMTSSITITLANDTFTGIDTSDYIAAGKVAVTNVPNGLVATVVKASSTTLTFSLTATASPHTAFENTTALTVTFANGAFTNTATASNVSYYNKSNLIVNFRDPYVLTYSGSTFNENVVDDGGINNSLTISMTGATSFAGAALEDFVLDSTKVSVSGVPTGLTATLLRTTSNTLTLSLTGNAGAHGSVNDVSNLTVTLKNGAFNAGNASQVTNYSRNDLVVDFISATIIPPTLVSVSNSTTTTALVSWVDNATNETSYTIERCNGTSCATTFTVAQSVTGLAANSNSYNFTGLTEGNYYMFRVRGVNTESTSSWALSGTEILFGGIQSTDNGTGSSTEGRLIDCRQQKNTYAVIYWNDLPGAVNYSIYDSSSGSDILTSTVLAGTNYYIARNLDYNTAYKYKVRVTMSGTGATSNNSTIYNITSSMDYAPCAILGGKTLYGGATRPQHLNAPTHTWIYNNKLFVTDKSNNRVLIWNTLPTSNTNPDVIIGQEKVIDAGVTIGITAGQNYNRTSNASVTAKSLYGPVTTWVGLVGGVEKMVVADELNHRVLIWNSIPTSDYQAADVVIGQPNFISATSDNGTRTKGLNSPWGVFSDGTRLFISDRANHRVLIYNTFPTSSYPTPNIYLGQMDNTQNSTTCAPGKFNSPRGLLTVGTKLLVADASNHRVHIYNNYPGITGITNGSTSISANIQMGTTGTWGLCGSNAGAARFNSPFGLAYDSVNDKLYVAESGNHRVGMFNGIPVTDNPSNQIGSLGLSNTSSTASVSASCLNAPTMVAVSAPYIYVADQTNSRVPIFTTIPVANNTDANGFLGRSTTFNANMNSQANFLSPSSTTFATIQDVTISGGQLFAADRYNHRVLVWTLPITSNDQAPNFVIGQTNFTNTSASDSKSGLREPVALTAGDNRLFVVEYSGHRVSIFDLPIASNGPNKSAVLGQPSYTSNSSSNAPAYPMTKSVFNNPHGAFYDENTKYFSVSDFGNHRVLFWNDIITTFKASSSPTTMTGGACPGASCDAKQPPADNILGTNALSGIIATRLNSPVGVSSDATGIWVADWSNRRILKYNFPLTGYPVTPSIVLGQSDYITNTAGTSQVQIRRCFKPLQVGTKIYCADEENFRIVMWNNPAGDGDVMVSQQGQVDFTQRREFESGAKTPLGRVRGMATDGTKLYIADERNNRIIIMPLFD